MKNLVPISDKLDELPNHESFRPKSEWVGENRKPFNYNRLVRFLNSRMGQHWNNVFSEFVHFDWIPVQYRTLEQISYYVEINTFIDKDGDIAVKRNYIFGDGVKKISELTYRRPTLYVHPETGVLCEEKNRKDKRDASPPDFIVLGDYHQLIKLDGIWYEVKGEKIDIQNRYCNKRVGPRDKMIYPRDIKQQLIFTDVKILYKKQLNSKELKKYGLKND